MSDDTPAIFAEGIAITTTSDGAYRVEDIASGLPIGRVVELQFEEPDEDERSRWWNVGKRLDTIAVLTIETLGMRCVLRMQAEVEHSPPMATTEP